MQTAEPLVLLRVPMDGRAASFRLQSGPEAGISWIKFAVIVIVRLEHFGHCCGSERWSGGACDLGWCNGSHLGIDLPQVVLVVYLKRKEHQPEDGYLAPKADEWEVPQSKLVVKEEIGSGEYGVLMPSMVLRLVADCGQAR